ncbi:MAG: integrase/recombinase XerC, partial [Ulvibacter sp.]
MPIKSFIDYLTFEKKYSEHTIIAYQKDLSTFRNFCIEEYGSQDLLIINYPQIRSWIVQLVDSGITNRSVNRKVSSLKSFYKFLQKTKQI